MKITLCATSILAASISMPVNSQSITTGNGVIDGCKYAAFRDKSVGDVNMLLVGFCQGIVFGVFDARKDLSFCPPSKAPLGQGVKILAKYLENNPDKLHLPATVLAELSFKEAWPCQ